MKVELIDSVDAFIEVSTPFRAADPLRTNVIGSVSLAVSTGRSTYDDYHWWVVRDEAGEVVGAAIRTSPYNLNVAPMRLDAARELGRAVGLVDDALPGVAGTPDVVEAFVKGYVESKSPGSKRAVLEHRRDLLYELEELTTPETEGFGRVAGEAEIENLAAMVFAFSRDIGHNISSMVDSTEIVTMSVSAGTLFCWEVDGNIVSLAGHAPIVTTGSIVVGRVGPVYTPPKFRRQGFASAVTAHASRHLIEKGARVMLFTDAANPTSNRIYQDIGYRLIDEMVVMRFEGN
jgi:predicted GNAT family acetyltransferase